MSKRAILQDRDISQVTSNVKTKRLYVALHFTTAEFDYDTGRIFVAQLLEHLERIAPNATHQTERDHQPTEIRVRAEIEESWHHME